MAPNSASQSAIHRPYSRSNISSPRHSSLSHPPPRVLSGVAPHNLPLEPPRGFSTPEPWTPARLNREREDFYTTRVTGRPEVWSAIQAACELAREGQIENAHGILDASGVTLPNGSLVDGGYDEVGNLYKVPEWCLTTPENLQKEGHDQESETMGADTFVADLGAQKDASPKVEAMDLEKRAAEQRRDEKGKGKATVEVDAVNVRCRLSDRGGPDVIISLGQSQPVSTLARRVKDEAVVSCPPTSLMRIADQSG